MPNQAYNPPDYSWQFSSINAQTGTTFTPAIADDNKLVTLSNTAAITVSIPTNASVAYPIGSQLNFAQINTGQVTIQAATSGTTTINSTGATAIAPKLASRYSMATAIKTATDVWLVVGDIV